MADDRLGAHGLAGVIASDLDGTLFGADHELSDGTIETLLAARSAGWRIVAATGRAPRSAMQRLARHDVIDALICSNGSIVHDVVLDATVRRFTIDPDHLVELFVALDASIADLAYCWEMADGSAWDPGFSDIAVGHDDLQTFGVGPRPGAETPVTKVMVRHPEVRRQELADLLEPHLPAPLTLGCSGVDFVEITGVGVDKSHALAGVVGAWDGVPSDVIAFGDNHNDVQMLRWAGRGVAVANAVDAAKHAADEVIGHHGDDSVAAYIERLLSVRFV